jgi:S1-C subfamily serine protease
MEFNEGRMQVHARKGGTMMRYMATVLLLVAAMSAQNAPSTNKGRLLDIPAISREANGSIVSIVMSDKDGHPIAQGSGFLISKDGLVVTNYHVIRNGRSALVKLPNGTFFTVDGVLASDKIRDVAVIEAHGSDFRTLTLGDSDRLQVGEEVVAIGNPLSLESTVSNGIVSAIRTVEDEGGKFVQITAPISPGSSGGPLFNMAGQVVGITTSHLVGGQNLNFAIPINDVKIMLRTTLSTVSALPDEPEDKPTSTEQGPDLKATVNFMRKMVEPDGRLIGYDVKQDNGVKFDFVGDAAASCDINFSGYYRRAAAIVDGLDYKKKDFTYAIIHEMSYVRVSLGAIDPSTIRSAFVLSSEYMEKMTKAHGQILASDIQNSDEKIVTFKDSDGSTKNFGVLIFLSKDRAERFVTAMKHAVTLCGGKESPFAPTATQ